MKSKVVAVLKSPFRLLAMLLRLLRKPLAKLGTLFAKLGRLLAKLGRLLGPLGRLFAKLGRLKGKPRIVLVVGIAVAAVVLVLAIKPGGGDDSQAVHKTLDRFALATREKDYQTLCDDLFASALAETIRSVGLPCEVALRTGWGSRQNPQLKVIKVEVNGDQALARTRSTAVGESPADETLRLVREDGSWRLASAPAAETGSAATP
ncbi:MAG: hypothetical protein QOD83_1118 [Solirubrobacteraceae bacterium]|jgi:hypothetical protein|nr:hypothetical protein [Solirubrobacteraceae bacterium]